MLLRSNTIELRYVDVDDANFILNLRLDKRYNKYLSKVSESVADQIAWIVKYKEEERNNKQFYFIICRKEDKKPCGTVRVYDLQKNSFCWGSWILNEDKTHYAAIESALLVYKFGFDKLKYNYSHFDVRKDNKKVISFHLKMGASVTHEDGDSYYFIINREQVNEVQKNLKIQTKIINE